MLPTRVEIPSAFTTSMLIAKLPLLACALVVIAVALPFVWLKTIKVVALAVPLWGFLRYHTCKDPLFLQKLLGQIAFKRYYFHG